jgi:deoxyribodipyrimidine photolyase-related protein
VTRILLVAFDQLNRQTGVLRDSDPEQDEILFIQNQSMLESRVWHRQRLHFLLSTVAHFQEELRAEGFTVHQVSAVSTRKALAHFAGQKILAARPSSHRALERLTGLGVEVIENDHFLTSTEEFQQWAGTNKALKMEPFYRWQRKRLDLLMDGKAPLGGEWNYDAENRLPPPRKPYTWPAPLSFEADEIDKEQAELVERFNVVGALTLGTWGSTRADALRQLRYFVDHSLRDFGAYEDAMPSNTWSVNHSLLSPYLNAGLLTPMEVIKAAVERFQNGGIPLPSIEGFVRQISGWREYINGVYWLFGDQYRDENQLHGSRKLLPLFTDSTKTEMKCVSSIVHDVEERAWVHHIPRLMVLSNLALLTGVIPSEYLDWMRRYFIDAADWVMVPNVIGMGVHADGGRMMTKPYAAGGAYIKRMSNYCGGCRFNPTKRTGEDACPFTTLYWDFLDRNRDEFSNNHRILPQLRGLDRLADLPEVRQRAQEVLKALSEGTM